MEGHWFATYLLTYCTRSVPPSNSRAAFQATCYLLTHVLLALQPLADAVCGPRPRLSILLPPQDHPAGSGRGSCRGSVHGRHPPARCGATAPRCFRRRCVNVRLRRQSGPLAPPCSSCTRARQAQSSRAATYSPCFYFRLGAAALNYYKLLILAVTLRAPLGALGVLRRLHCTNEEPAVFSFLALLAPPRCLGCCRPPPGRTSSGPLAPQGC